jgi:type I restriction enzyme, R subunit
LKRHEPALSESSALEQQAAVVRDELPRVRSTCSDIVGIERLDLNDRIADAVEKADLDPDQTTLLERLLGRDYEVITADDRLDKLADDFVEHASTRWETGKSMFVCIDKITCARMLQRIEPRWKGKLAQVEALVSTKETLLAAATDADEREFLGRELEALRGQARWMASTIIEIIISEAQNEVRDFQKWDFDIIPHRTVMKTGFQTPDGKRVAPDEAFKDPEHPFRIAIVCAMWLTGFDVECLATLYIDKPMKAHILDNLYELLPRPPYTEQDTDEVAKRIYEYVRERSASGDGLAA